jgi:hypothetical protein
MRTRAGVWHLFLVPLRKHASAISHYRNRDCTGFRDYTGDCSERIVARKGNLPWTTSVRLLKRNRKKERAAALSQTALTRVSLNATVRSRSLDGGLLSCIQRGCAQSAMCHTVMPGSNGQPSREGVTLVGRTRIDSDRRDPNRATAEIVGCEKATQLDAAVIAESQPSRGIYLA